MITQRSWGPLQLRGAEVGWWGGCLIYWKRGFDTLRYVRVWEREEKRGAAVVKEEGRAVIYVLSTLLFNFLFLFLFVREEDNPPQFSLCWLFLSVPVRAREEN